MDEVLGILRDCEYLSENFEEDSCGECTKEEVQQSCYEMLYFRKLADYLEEMLKSGEYSEIEMTKRLRNFFNKMYLEFEKNSKQSIKMKKKATILKMQAFSRVYDVLEDALN